MGDNNKYRNLNFKKSVLITGIVLLFFGVFFSEARGQCSSFARAVVKPDLTPYVHDGNYNAAILGEGEAIVLRKTVFNGQKYRLVVKGVPDLPGVRFRLVDENDNILFDNANHDYVSHWDFDVQGTRTLSVEVAVLEDEASEKTTGGCVAVLFGLDTNHK